MKIIGKITRKVSSDKGISLTFDLVGSSEQDKGLLEQLDKWACIGQELNLILKEDEAQKKLGETK